MNNEQPQITFTSVLTSIVVLTTSFIVIGVVAVKLSKASTLRTR